MYCSSFTCLLLFHSLLFNIGKRCKFSTKLLRNVWCWNSIWKGWCLLYPRCVRSSSPSYCFENFLNKYYSSLRYQCDGISAWQSITKPTHKNKNKATQSITCMLRALTGLSWWNTPVWGLRDLQNKSTPHRNVTHSSPVLLAHSPLLQFHPYLSPFYIFPCTHQFNIRFIPQPVSTVMIP